MICYLVGALEQFYFSRNIGNVIIPTDFHIFQRGGLTTNQVNYVQHSAERLFYLGEPFGDEAVEQRLIDKADDTYEAWHWVVMETDVQPRYLYHVP